jgi:ribosomal protein L28
VQHEWDEIGYTLARKWWRENLKSRGIEEQQEQVRVGARTVRALENSRVDGQYMKHLLPKTAYYLRYKVRRQILFMLLDRVSYDHLPAELLVYIHEHLLLISNTSVEKSMESETPTTEDRATPMVRNHEISADGRRCADGQCCCSHRHGRNKRVYRWNKTSMAYTRAHMHYFSGPKLFCDMQDYGGSAQRIQILPSFQNVLEDWFEQTVRNVKRPSAISGWSTRVATLIQAACSELYRLVIEIGDRYE